MHLISVWDLTISRKRIESKHFECHEKDIDSRDLQFSRLTDSITWSWVETIPWENIFFLVVQCRMELFTEESGPFLIKYIRRNNSKFLVVVGSLICKRNYSAFSSIYACITEENPSISSFIQFLEMDRNAVIGCRDGRVSSTLKF